MHAHVCKDEKDVKSEGQKPNIAGLLKGGVQVVADWTCMVTMYSQNL